MSNRSEQRMKTLINKTKLVTKLFPKGKKISLMDFFYEKLETLFDNPPSNLGYKSDIESILNELGIKKEHLLKMSINSLSKTVRNKQEIKIIASYLFFMQDFLKLLKAKGNSEKEQILLKDLLTLSEAMLYEKHKKNTVLLRYGEKGNTAYIILSGDADVLIETSSIRNMGEKCYLFYLANLIKYQEYGLLNLTVNENFKIFPIDIIDDITIKSRENNNARRNSIPDNISISSFNINNANENKNANNNILRSSTKNSKDKKNSLMNKIKKITLPNNIKTDRSNKSHKSSQRKKGEGGDNEPLSSSRKNDSKRDSQRGFFKLNFMNEELKELQKIKKYKARELLDMFGLKLSDKKLNKNLNHCNTNDFIERLNVFDYLDKKFKELEEKKIEEERKKEEKKMNSNLGITIINDINGVSTQKEKSKKEIIQVVIPEDKNKNNEAKESKKKKTPEKKLKAFKSRGSIDKRNSRIHSILNTDNDNDNNEIMNDENDDSEESEIDKENKSFVSFSPAFLEEMNHNMVMGLKIFSYIKVATIGTGCLFGEMALTDPNSLRKATIITSSECHFSVLNKKTFNNCIKIGAQRHLRELLQFFIKLPIFSGIPEGVFYNKYYTNLTKVTVLKGKNIVNQGEKPEYITLLQSGQYGVTTFMSLYDLTRLIFRYAKLFNNNNDISNLNKNNNKKENSNNNISLNDIKSKYKILIQNVLKIMNEENSLLNDNIIFKKFYYSQQLIRISEISCPDIILNDEYLDDSGSFAFSIEAKAPENIIFTMSNKFYFNLRNKNISVKINQDKLLYKKINLMLQRLLIIRNSMINSFFDSKTQKEIGALVIKELDDVISTQLLKKRSLIKKDEIILSSNDNENKESKDKEILIQYNLSTNPNLNSNNLSHSHLIKNKRMNSNKNNKESATSIIDFKSYLKNIKNSKKKKKVIGSIKLHDQLDKNKLKKSKNSSNNNINNPKLISLKRSESKKNNNSFKIYKKELAVSPVRRFNLTSRDWKLNNNLPFKDNEDVILYPLYDRTLTNERCNESNYINRVNFTNSFSNNNISRNTKNEYTQMKYINENKYTSSKPYFSSLQEKSLFPGACKVEMSNLVWENLKSAAIKEKQRQRLNYFNYNITTANFHKKNKTNKIINFSLKNYIEINMKCISNRNNRNPNLNLPKKNLSNEDNERLIKSNNNDEKNKSKEFSVSNFNVLSSFLSTIKNNNNNNNRIKTSQNINGQKDLLNLKLNKNNDSNLPKIKLNIKKFYSPQEVNLMRISRKMRYVMDGIKYTKIKGDKFKTNRKDYYNKNLRSRMNFFYG